MIKLLSNPCFLELRVVNGPIVKSPMHNNNIDVHARTFYRGRKAGRPGKRAFSDQLWTGVTGNQKECIASTKVRTPS